MLRCGGFTLVAALLFTSSALCRVADDLATVQPLSSEAKGVKDTFLCEVCGVFWEVLDDVLGDQEVDDWLIKYVQENMCPKLPTEEAQEECVEKAPTFVPAVIHWVEGLANSTMCTDAGVCGDRVPLTAPVEMDQQEDEECLICKNLTALLKAEAQKVHTETLVQKIEDLKNVCGRLGGDEAQQCKQIVDKYGYLLVYFIEKEKAADIEKTCSDLGICPRPSSTPVIDPLPAELVRQIAVYAITTSNDEDECDYCKDLMTTVRDSLRDPKTQETDIEYLSRACAWIPIYSEDCREAVRNYTTQALNTIANQLEPDRVCTFLKACGEEWLAMGEAATIEEKNIEELVWIQ